MGCLKANQKCFVLQFGGLFLVFNFCAGELGWKDCVFVHQVFTNSITSIDHQSLWAVSTHTDNQSLIKWMLLAAVAVSSHAVGLETNAFMLPPPPPNDELNFILSDCSDYNGASVFSCCYHSYLTLHSSVSLLVIITGWPRSQIRLAGRPLTYII